MRGSLTASVQPRGSTVGSVDYFWNAVWSLTPTIILGAAFWYIIWSILRADRREREEYLKIEQQVRAERAAQESADQR
jgi:peptidoglycan/LPS O-acetylase OafA/YrhL